MNKRIEEKVKDDRMSNQATFIAAKRQEIAILTEQIETKLTQQGDPAVAAVEAASMKNDLKDAERSCAEAKEALASARDLDPSHSRNNVLQWRVSPHRQWKSSCQTLYCGSRQAFVVVSIRTVTCRLAMRWCAYSMRNLMEMKARSCVASRVLTRSVLRK